MTSYALGLSVRKLYNWPKPYVKCAGITPHFLAIRQITSQNRRPTSVDLGTLLPRIFLITFRSLTLRKLIGTYNICTCYLTEDGVAENFKKSLKDIINWTWSYDWWCFLVWYGRFDQQMCQKSLILSWRLQSAVRPKCRVAIKDSSRISTGSHSKILGRSFCRV